MSAAPDPWLTEKEAAAELRVSQGTVRRERIEGRLGYAPIRGRIFYPLSMINEYRDSLKKKPCQNTSSLNVPTPRAGISDGPRDAVAAANRQAQKIVDKLNSSSRRSA